MASGTAAAAASPRDEANDLIVRRVRIGVLVVQTCALPILISNYTLMPPRASWAYLLDMTGFALVALALWLLRLSAVRRHPITFALCVGGTACSLRAVAGIWLDDLAQTAILCVAVALTAGATLPWGVRPQLIASAFAGGAVAANAYMANSVAAEVPHVAVAVVISLAVSVILAYELQRHGEALANETARPQRAEADLARLNSELEQRVAKRTAELAAAMHRVEREALERQQATLELDATQKRLQDILDNAPAAIQLKDTAGRYLLVNRDAKTTRGMPRDQLSGRSPHDIFPAQIADTLLANDRRVLEQRAPLQLEETIRHPDGSWHIYLSVKVPLFDADGAPMGVCGISTDITARNQMEAELRRSEASLSALVENTTDSIWSVDRNGVIQVMNSVFRERFRTRYGVDYDRAISEAVVPQGIWDDLFALYARAFRGEHVQVERTIPRNGEPEHFLISVHPIIENGVVTGATVFSKDITERKRVEARAREHQAELAHVLRLGTMGEMAAGVGHEIHQPLGAIANYAQGCVHRLRSGSSDAAALLPIIEEIAREALRAGEII